MLLNVSANVIGLSLLFVFFAITFLQSAVDKVVDRKGNLDFITSHFSKSPLASMTPLLFNVLTVFEFLSGALCLVAIVSLWLFNSTNWAVLALAVCGLNLLMLLFGQRLAKDYAGASTIGIYMALLMTGFLLL